MSRGPGKWQRLILERLETREQFYLAEILPYHTIKVHDPDEPAWVEKQVERQGFRRHDRMAALRAAHRLAARGLIVIEARRFWTNRVYWTGERWQPLGAVIVARRGTRINSTMLELAYELAERKKGVQEAREWLLKRAPEINVGSSEPPTLKPSQLGAVASTVTLLGSWPYLVKQIVRELAERWGLPASEIDHVLLHHDPYNARDLL
jgi:hypothetical protein